MVATDTPHNMTPSPHTQPLLYPNLPLTSLNSPVHYFIPYMASIHKNPSSACLTPELQPLGSTILPSQLAVLPKQPTLSPLTQWLELSVLNLMVNLEHLSLAEFFKCRIYDSTPAHIVLTPCHYDIIFGRDACCLFRITIDFKNNDMHIDSITVNMRPTPKPNTIHQSKQPNFLVSFLPLMA